MGHLEVSAPFSRQGVALVASYSVRTFDMRISLYEGASHTQLRYFRAQIIVAYF